MRRLPSVRARGYFNAWPEIVRSREEIADGEIQPLRLQATTQAVSRMEETLQWVSWVLEAERRLIWQRAARLPWKEICYSLGCDRSTAWRKWNIALAKIAARLNAEKK
ncbi:DUF6362 family protein [Bartonella queenslandensis]|uniref:DUF6362 family protein n=1 Tax=Bartonella queenslandensis TaxID=481138 RepID=UPI001FCBA3AD|nr:DUF6362 family protein [Bartonella queenslandensis]